MDELIQLASDVKALEHAKLSLKLEQIGSNRIDKQNSSICRKLLRMRELINAQCYAYKVDKEVQSE